MIIKPSIRSNFFTNAHPLGSEQYILSQINEAKTLPKFKGPKNVLIIGGSSGYGLSSRIALTYGTNANTINISFEAAPKGKRTGTAGYWNNLYFQNHALATPTTHYDFIGDAFSTVTKEAIVKKIKDTFGQVDLVIYSLAAGGRKDESTGQVVQSHIKTIGESVSGKTMDIKNESLVDISVESANEQEIKDTVFVMGGSDWSDWIHYLSDENVLSNKAKTIAYTYIGGPTTSSIYRDGTLGKAKEDLEKTANALNHYLKDTYEGEALISSSKAVVSKASVYIPQMPIYVSCLYDVMLKENIHESILAHKYRLFKDMVYGNDRILDDVSRIRLDHQEMDDTIQFKANALMKNVTEESIFSLAGTKLFLEDVYNLNGFNYNTVNYEQDLDIDALHESLLKTFKTV